MTSPALEGVQAYGAIRDEEIGLQPVPYYVKSWIQYDPSVRYAMLQSAPIMVPFRPNASVAVKVDLRSAVQSGKCRAPGSFRTGGLGARAR